MRTNLILVVVLVVALGAAAVFLKGESGRGGMGRALSVEDGGTARAEPNAGSLELPKPGFRSVVNAGMSVETGVPAPGSRANQSELASEAYARHIRERDEAAFWRRCINLEDEDLMRDCIQRDLGGRSMAAAELAAIVCGDIPPDAPDKMLVEEVASLWDPALAAGQMREFHSLCNSPGVIWRDFIELQLERDPAWVDEFVRSLDPGILYGGDDVLLLQTLDTLAQGDASLRSLLEGGAHGQFGGTEQQVAFAITRSIEFHAGSAERLEYLNSIIESPDFQARPSEVEAIVRNAMQGATSGDDPKVVIAFLDRLLEDPNVAQGTAEHIMLLYRNNRMPQWMPESERQHLVSRARDLLP